MSTVETPAQDTLATKEPNKTGAKDRQQARSARLSVAAGAGRTALSQRDAQEDRFSLGIVQTADKIENTFNFNF
ncbi:p8 [Panicum mosaic virus]|uniref:Probable movement protein p8 n=2 Tax=Panicum mosaic virus TaxID=40279 RepID=MP8_PMVK|nr:p8 [Panicum mosaic virus]P90335.1 RecName: Full=Probable movement protein p8 [Panicum mosaic virus strain Kansas 109S]AAC97553.1 movement protein 1 [Panicum mosaic virus]AYG96554.1 movement protein 1 [Panicum mosaic virus]